MDKGTIAGILLGCGGVLVGALLEGSQLSGLVNIPALLIVIVGSLGATTLSSSLDTMLRIPKMLRLALTQQHHQGADLVDLFVHMATRARKDGVLSLETEAAQLDDPFLRKGIQLVVDGVDEEIIRQVLKADIAATAERHEDGYAAFEAMGGYAPTMGILGAVLGLIHVLSKVEDPTKVAGGIAVAFVATLYGVGAANLLFLPLASKLRAKSKEELHLRALMLEGVIAIQNGDNPRIVRERLEVYLPPRARESARAAKAEVPDRATAASEAV